MSTRHSIARVQIAGGAALLSFVMGALVAQRSVAQKLAGNEARLEALRTEMELNLLQVRQQQEARAGTAGRGETAGLDRGPFVEEIKRELQREMGLLPMHVLRDRARSFVELNAWDTTGNRKYATAGYLGKGYFITVKHVVVALDTREDGHQPRRITRITLRYNDRNVPAAIVDTGDATDEVQAGDWAILKIKGDVQLAPLPLETAYAFDFATPIYRLGNDYSRGIVLSTGYAGQRTTDGLVTCLTDGHPGVSGGGVLDQHGTLVGMPIGRVRDDYRFSFILPLRPEMFRNVPGIFDEVTTTN